MSTLEEAVMYGKYVAFMIQTYRAEGMDAVLLFLEDMDPFQAKMLLAYLIQMHGEE